MKPSASLSVFAATIVFTLPAVADQTWSGVADALWSTSGNWTSGVPGSGEIAIFDATSLANPATTLGADQIVLGIKVLDPAGGISIAAGNSLTVGASGMDLSAATQNLTLNGAVVLGGNQTWNIASGRTLLGSATSVISGSGINLTKSGAGLLTLQGANTFSGTVNVTNGTLIVKNSAGAGTAGLVLGNGTTLRLERNGSVGTFIGSGVTVAPSASVVMTTDNAANGFGGLISGDAASVYQIGFSGATTQVSFSLGASTQQFGSFLGTVKIFDGASLRFSSTSGVNNGGVNTTFDLGATGNLTTRNSAIINIGAITGTGSLSGSSGATGTGTFSIGGKGTDSTFNGVITDSAASRFAALTKVGSGSLTLGGSNTYSGPTSITAGKLLVNGTISASAFGAASAVTVGIDGTLGGTGILNGVVTSNGTIAPGMGPGTLSINNTLNLNASAVLSCEFNGGNQTAGSGVNDLLSGITNLTLDGTLNVAELATFTGLSSGSWRLINYSGTLTDNGLTLGSTPASDPGTSFALDTSTPGQVNLVLVPEPGSLLLALLAGAGVRVRRRR